jgi:hypothetical protein
VPDTFQWPTVLLATDIDAVLNDYCSRVNAIRPAETVPTGILLGELLRTAMGCGPYPAMSWKSAFERTRLDLVLLFGIRALFQRFPFNNYALQFHDGAGRVDFMTRTETELLVGTAINTDAVSLPARCQSAFRRLRSFAPEAQSRVVLMDASVAPNPYAPRLQPCETLGLVDIHTGQARFISR